MHEYGHYLDSQKFGVLYLPVVGLPSLFNQIKSNKKGILTEWDGKPVVNLLDLRLHDVYWTETRANQNAADYFGEHHGVKWGIKFPHYPTRNPFK